MKKNLFIVLIFSFLFESCLTFENQYSGFAPGIWRGVLKLEQVVKPLNTHSAKLDADPNTKIDDVTLGELPFNFEVIYDSPKNFHIELINADERIRLDQITMGRSRKTGRDTFKILFPEYQTYLIGEIDGGVMQGKWVVPSKSEYSIAFVAKHGQSHRFSTLQKSPKIDLNGNWETTFGNDQPAENQEKAIGQFKVNGKKMTGTFATETGDYRFLEGEVQANKFYLSCFDGAHAFLFEGKIIDNDNLIGVFQSGRSTKQSWEAKRNENFKLKNAEEITKAVSQNASFNFSNPDGKMISLENEEYKGKPKIIQILGTWCPNCKDETRFLSDFAVKNPDVAVIGISFERHKEKAKADAALKNYRKAMNVPYEMVVGGYADKQEASQILPFLDKIAAFPTTVYLDKNNKIKKVYSGFYGPATKEYVKFKEEFEKYVQELKSL